MTALFIGKPGYFSQELYLMISITGLVFKIRPLDQQYQHHLNLGRYTNSQHHMKSTVSEALRVRLSCLYLQQTSKDFKTSALKCLVVKRYIHSVEDAGSRSLEVWIQVLLTLILTKDP